MMTALSTHQHILIMFSVLAGGSILSYFLVSTWLPEFTAITFSSTEATTTPHQQIPTDETDDSVTPPPTWPAPLDTQAYDARLLALAGHSSSTLIERTTVVTPTGTTTELTYKLQTSSTTNVTVEGYRWPVAQPYPHGGALLPFNRIVAYYGNFYSRYMGILGELPRAELITHLDGAVTAWEAADPNTPVIPAVHYIAMVAQGSAGADGMWRNVMPAAEIEKGYELAQEIDGVLFLDLQVGLSTLPQELPKFKEYLSRPDVHLGIDPEFSMKYGDAPGTAIGTFDASNINYTIDWLADIVNEHQLPPKVLVIHRFTQNMITNYQDIKPRPEVQVVIDMDGWGSKQLKRNTYQHVIVPEPVQFAGIKVFYKNDLKPPSTGLFTPAEILEFTPKPIYIQYQ